MDVGWNELVFHDWTTNSHAGRQHIDYSVIYEMGLDCAANGYREQQEIITFPRRRGRQYFQRELI